jgi:hypothetical protein
MTGTNSRLGTGWSDYAARSLLVVVASSRHKVLMYGVGRHGLGGQNPEIGTWPCMRFWKDMAMSASIHSESDLQSHATQLN